MNKCAKSDFDYHFCIDLDVNNMQYVCLYVCIFIHKGDEEKGEIFILKFNIIYQIILLQINETDFMLI